jgi:hypothetical protein
MVSEKPPRRSKTVKEPVTIDLSAEESSAVAEPVRSNDTDEPLAPATGGSEETSQDTFPGEGRDAVSNSNGEDAAPGFSAAEEPPAEIKADEVEETTSFAREAPEPEPIPEPAPAPPAPRPSPATSALIASGIFGGIVAVALAGSMQYAGYLPAASPASSTVPSAPAVDTAPLSAEIASLRQEVAALKERPAGDPELQARVQALESSASTPDQAESEDLAALRTDVDTLRSAVESTAGNDAELERRLAAAETRLNQPGAEEMVARAVAAAALKAAIDRGGPFATELETFAGVAPDDPAVAGLQTFSATGVPSRAELQQEFQSVADAILDTLNQPDPSQGFASRLMTSALSVVKVRRVGDVEGDTPEAVVARIENSLRGDNLEAAATEWAKLPEAAKAVSQQFKQKLDGRIEVEKLVGDTLTRAVSNTGTQG